MISDAETIANTTADVIDLAAYRAARNANRTDPDPTPTAPAVVLTFPAVLAVAA